MAPSPFRLLPAALALRKGHAARVAGGGFRHALACCLGLAAAAPALAQPTAPDAAASSPAMPAAAGSAQNASAPLTCQRAALVVLPTPCPPGHSCQAGTTPGMLQKRGPVGGGVTGGALAFGPASSAGQRSVQFDLQVPDVARFAPTTWVMPRPLQTELWLVKRTRLPDAGVSGRDIADHTVQVHNGAPFSVARSGSTQAPAGDGPMGLRVASPWQLVGLVSARHGRKGAARASYGFVCDLPVTNAPPPAR